MSERAKAIAYVTALIASYRSAASVSRSRVADVFYRERVGALTRELGELQGASEDAERRARSWCTVAAL